MKTTITTLAILTALTIQAQEISKNEAYELYKKSNVRKEIGLTLKDFKKWTSEPYNKNQLVLKSFNNPKLRQEIKKLWELGIWSINRAIRNEGSGPCDDCTEVLQFTLEDLKEHLYFDKNTKIY